MKNPFPFAAHACKCACDDDVVRVRMYIYTTCAKKQREGIFAHACALTDPRSARRRRCGSHSVAASVSAIMSPTAVLIVALALPLVGATTTESSGQKHSVCDSCYSTTRVSVRSVNRNRIMHRQWPECWRRQFIWSGAVVSGSIGVCPGSVTDNYSDIMSMLLVLLWSKKRKATSACVSPITNTYQHSHNSHVFFFYIK